MYVPGRGAQIKDVLIDSLGAIVGLLIYCFVIYIINRLRIGKSQRKDGANAMYEHVSSYIAFDALNFIQEPFACAHFIFNLIQAYSVINSALNGKNHHSFPASFSSFRDITLSIRITLFSFWLSLMRNFIGEITPSFVVQQIISTDCIRIFTYNHPYNYVSTLNLIIIEQMFFCKDQIMVWLTMQDVRQSHKIKKMNY